MHPLLALKLFALVSLANATPVLVKRLLGERLAWPLDGGLVFADGQPVFGRSKTWRGIVLAILATAAGGAVLGLGWRIGLTIGAFAMAGDLFSSFLKRRFRLQPSARASGLDQVPEALFPLLACRAALGLAIADIALVVAAFTIAEVLGSRVLFRLGLRDRPY